MEVESNIVDDRGTGQDQAHEILKAFCDNGFNGDNEKAGLVLGRPPGEIREMLDGGLDIDDDLAMKVRGIAEERGIALQ
jgi:hypothetical protein